jgi:hypothetical protein
MAEIVALPQLGGCLCGAARYSLTGAPLLAYACHCHDCQTRSGAAFTLTLVIQTADIALTGAVESRRSTTRSGREVDHTSCARCRTRLLGCAPAAPDFASLLAGTLDDASWVRPISQTFVGSAIPWAVIPGVRHVDWSGFDFIAQGRDWQASAPAFEITRGRE